ncbi:MAG: DUF3168 domain-containing protein [Hyphomonadaceae bacterium]|nr:DUF3168 domain-containing protein [Hyphomonadaceae bacterium]
MSAPETALRAAIIARLKADTDVRATALGNSPRIANRAPPERAKPYVIVTCEARPYETQGEGAPPDDCTITVMIYVEGDFEGDEEGEAIFSAFRKSLRAWIAAGSVSLSGHRLVNLTCTLSGISSGEAGKSYAGRQDWRAVTEQES